MFPSNRPRSACTLDVHTHFLNWRVSVYFLLAPKGDQCGGAVQARSVVLASGGTHSWTDGTSTDIRWNYEFLGGRSGAYRVSGSTMTVTPPRTVPVTAVTVDMVERLLRSGKVDKQLTRALSPTGGVFSTTFNWESTTNNLGQELTVRLERRRPKSWRFSLRIRSADATTSCFRSQSRKPVSGNVGESYTPADRRRYRSS